MKESFLSRRMHSLEIQRLDQAAPAGLTMISLPLPRGCRAEDVGIPGRSSHCEGLGRWPDSPENSPRRGLIIADNEGEAPATLRIGRPDAVPETPCPSAAMTLIRRSPDPFFVWEQHALNLSWGETGIQIAMGLRTGGRVQWWEACRLVTLKSTPACVIVEMGGAIPVAEYDAESFKTHPGYKNPYLHKHNWISGHIYARLHSNGVCEIFAHHVNNKFVDDGAAFEDVVPVIGFRSDGAGPAHFSSLGDWDGTRDEFDFGKAAFDVSEAALLATPAQPGRMDAEDDFLVWQPYEGVELYSGVRMHSETGDPYIFRSRERRFPRGMARTIRYRISLNPRRSPRLARYLAPAWWYGACEEFQSAPYLPVFNEFDRLVNGMAGLAVQHTHAGGFEDGNIPRGLSFVEGSKRPEPGWEGEAPYGLFLHAWRTGDAAAFATAMRASWFFTDVIIDHAAKQVRMHGYPPNAFALPMARVLAPIAVWLETGDPYLIDAARAVTETAHWTEKNSWPRLSVGRDACYLRGAVMLYRYLGTDRYLEIAREGIGHVLASQFEDGSFGDQGGGARIHQFSSYVIKPWMAFMAIGGVMDYLEMFPGDSAAIDGVRRLADWLMRERFAHSNGITGWTYQHAFNGGDEYRDLYSGKISKLKAPGASLWHMEYMARFFMYCTLKFKNPAYFEAWLENSRGYYADKKLAGGDHTIAQTLQYVPRLQDWLWRATADKDGICAHPVRVGPNTPQNATILGPEGPVKVAWRDGSVVCIEGTASLLPEILG